MDVQVNRSDSPDTGATAPAWKMLVFGILTLWMPYVFVWFVLKPTYPRWYRTILIAWAVFFVGCALIYIVLGMLGLAY